MITGIKEAFTSKKKENGWQQTVNMYLIISQMTSFAYAVMFCQFVKNLVSFLGKHTPVIVSVSSGNIMGHVFG